MKKVKEPYVGNQELKATMSKKENEVPQVSKDDEKEEYKINTRIRKNPEYTEPYTTYRVPEGKTAKDVCDSIDGFVSSYSGDLEIRYDTDAAFSVRKKDDGVGVAKVSLWRIKGAIYVEISRIRLRESFYRFKDLFILSCREIFPENIVESIEKRGDIFQIPQLE